MTDEPKPVEPTVSEEVQEADDALTQATKIKDAMKTENDRREALIIREEKLAAANTLRGRAIAGQPKEEPKEETPDDYARKVMANDIPEK